MKAGILERHCSVKNMDFQVTLYYSVNSVYSGVKHSLFFLIRCIKSIKLSVPQSLSPLLQESPAADSALICCWEEDQVSTKPRKTALLQ